MAPRTALRPLKTYGRSRDSKKKRISSQDSRTRRPQLLSVLDRYSSQRVRLDTSVDGQVWEDGGPTGSWTYDEYNSGLPPGNVARELMYNKTLDDLCFTSEPTAEPTSEPTVEPTSEPTPEPRALPSSPEHGYAPTPE